MSHLCVYLLECVENGSISEITRQRVESLWTGLRVALGAITDPNACPGPDGQIVLSWDKGGHHLEIELFPDGEQEFFHSGPDVTEGGR